MKEKLKAHVSKKHEWSVPQWAIYAVGSFALVAFIYGSVQQFRVWRWSKLLKGAHLKIQELEGDKQTIALETTRKLGQQGLKMSKDRIQKLDAKIKELRSKKEKLKKDVGSLSSEDLAKAFREEGF